MQFYCLTFHISALQEWTQRVPWKLLFVQMLLIQYSCLLLETTTIVTNNYYIYALELIMPTAKGFSWIL